MTNEVTACIDGSKSSVAVCDAAVWAGLQLNAPLTLLHVLEKSSFAESDLSGSIGLGVREHLLQQLTELDAQRSRLAMESSRLMLEDTAIRINRDHPRLKVDTLQRHGRLSDNILDRQDQINLLIIGRQGQSHDDNDSTQVGSQLETVTRTVRCPVLVTTDHFTPPQRIMMAFDGTPAALDTIKGHLDSPLLEGTECHLVMVNHDDSAHIACFGEATKLLQSREGMTTVTAHLTGELEQVLKDYKQQHDIQLIVMGAYGHSRFRQFFIGSHTRNMLSHTRIPLLLLR